MFSNLNGKCSVTRETFVYDIEVAEQRNRCQGWIRVSL